MDGRTPMEMNILFRITMMEALRAFRNDYHRYLFYRFCVPKKSKEINHRVSIVLITS